jgi:hypothetical protein
LKHFHKTTHDGFELATIHHDLGAEVHGIPTAVHFPTLPLLMLVFKTHFMTAGPSHPGPSLPQVTVVTRRSLLIAVELVSLKIYKDGVVGISSNIAQLES